MTKLLKFVLPLAVMLSVFSGCNNIVKDSSQSSQETTSQTASETTTEQTEAKKELKGDMTIRKAYKLPDLGCNVVEDTPTLIGNKVIFGIKTGEALAKYNVSDEVNDYERGFYPIDIVAIDGVTGEKKTVYSDVMLDSYNITPGNDEKTAYLEYYDKTNIADTSAVKIMEDVQKHRRVIKLDLENATYKELDFSKYDGSIIMLNPLGEKNLIITQFKDVPATAKDFEGRNIEFSDEYSKVRSRTIDIMNVNSGEIKNFSYDKMAMYIIVPGEKRMNMPFYYDDTVIYQTEELTADNTYKAGFQVYDENMNLIYEDVVDSIENYQSGNYINFSTGISNGDIYASSDKCRATVDGINTDEDVKVISSYYIYHKKGNTYEKAQTDPPAEEMMSFYQVTPKTHPEINYSMVQITDDTRTATQLSLSNVCTGEYLKLNIDVEGLEVPRLKHGNCVINNDGSGNMIIVGNGSDTKGDLVFWFVPKEEIKRALYGE